ncbi:hypothetical protein ACPTGM_02525 [Pseudomonas aeruginosa]|uniref:hypothetical protein n=1 Tax=Pseudomonas aeruginosa TaxID=287 RepID=UPI0015E70819|nr:hypothetical protein [Pseudomonas aeruginosa]ELW9769856.1 hypothetical protein [Pseudomonas aeruginosa]MDS9748364.1 hypothetical protein [Pseudomonas aeruginosa]MDS9767329.1 hypothetical protein [Pseudomonas aeruginosa]MDS9798364.1 hypothetical protein [Pseudomonas aeruginosa]HCF4470599.1 hypothetical protein [Pseudomonas aeruginosa]
MSVTPDAVNSDHFSGVMNAIDQQIKKEMDSVRAKLYWQNALENIPPETLAEALAAGLSSKRYQEVPACRCCRHRG